MVATPYIDELVGGQMDIYIGAPFAQMVNPSMNVLMAATSNLSLLGVVPVDGGSKRRRDLSSWLFESRGRNFRSTLRQRPSLLAKSVAVQFKDLDPEM